MGAKVAQWSRAASAARSSSSAATTRPSSPRRPTSHWRCAASPSRPPAPRGQRCTTLRRLIVHRSRVDEVTSKVAAAFASLPVGDPLRQARSSGRSSPRSARAGRMLAALEQAMADGGHVVVGGERLFADEAPDAAYVRPAVVSMPAQTEIVRPRPSHRCST
ncbi:MAG: aldehyde dehydrogenase family protein [Ilumatobacteraceae bacterium]